MLGLLFSLLAIVIVVGGILVVCEIGDGIDRRRSKRIMAMRRHPASGKVTMKLPGGDVDGHWTGSDPRINTGRVARRNPNRQHLFDREDES